MPGILPKWQETLRAHETHGGHVADESMRLQREEGLAYGEAQRRAEVKFATEKVPEADLYDAIAMQKRAELDAAREGREVARAAMRGDDA